MSQILCLILFLSISAWAGGESLPWPPPKAGAKRRFVGFRLSKVDPGSVYEKAGLRTGDIVRSLNGKEILKPEDLQELPAILERDKVVTVKVERAGKRKTFRYRRVQKRVPAGKRP